MHSEPCSTICARLRKLSSVSWDIAIGLAFVVGLLLFGISSSMLRTASQTPPAPKGPYWTKLVDESLSGVDKQLRLDIVERLSLLQNEWSQNILEQAREEERDPDVLAAIDRVLQ